MDIESLLKDKNIKTKAKTEALSQMLLDGNICIKALINAAKAAKDPDKATCIEAMEFATQTNPRIATEDCLNFVSTTLAEKAPRVKWESAKVVGNIAPLFPDKLDEAIKNLLLNSEHMGTVVRWSAAYALGEILKLNTKQNEDLIPAIEAICTREEKNSIKKIYLAAIKQTHLSG